MKVRLKVSIIGSAPGQGSLVQPRQKAREVTRGDPESVPRLKQGRGGVWLAGKRTFLYKVMWMLIGSLQPGLTHI